MEKKTEARVSFGFAEALAILFIALKLTHVIDWPWLWVLSPIWISIAIVIVIGLIIFIIGEVTKRRW